MHEWLLKFLLSSVIFSIHSENNYDSCLFMKEMCKFYFCVGRSARLVNVISVLLLLSHIISLNGYPVSKTITVKSRSDRPTEVSPIPKSMMDLGKNWISIGLQCSFYFVIKYSPLLMRTPPRFSTPASARSHFLPRGD